MLQKLSFDPARYVAKASPPSPGAEQLPARVGAPPYADRECDIALPDRLFSAIAINGQPREIRRALTESERGKLESRHEELRAGLIPFAAGERDKVDVALGAMFGGFRAMRHEGENAEAVLDITSFVLREFPRWAIEEGCLMIAQGRAGLDKRFAPNDTEIFEVIAGIVAPYRRKLATVEGLLVAPVEKARGTAA